MYEIISSDVKVQSRLTMKGILSVYQNIKGFEGNIYFMCNHKIIDAQKLSKLVSFMLTIEEDSLIKIIVEGKEVQQKLEDLKENFDGHFQPSGIRQPYFVNPTDTVRI
ncbi:HPr family phosphocarrier protein [Peribacillus saganii]|uniref:HPr family phosphocarrier protein n=1 Tax=Peribacillus saganii TaxID=2303992 RepID=A0A372LS80_9BACI|nr:HPr family phosphocarrier protein [Peribacillus saganii]RFU70652.1 HPr family phosphocarrier protein [Peribacillus saganii]